MDDEKNAFMNILKTYYIDVSSSSVFVETGTCDGHTAMAASKYFETVFSVENNINLMRAEEYKKISEAYPNIKIFNDVSTEFLKKILPTISEKICFVLDAHNHYTSPVIQELQIIRQNSSRNDHVILIDDTMDCGNGTWPTLNQLMSLLKDINSNYTIIEIPLHRQMVLAFVKAVV